jgi:hypothetical protein
MTNLHHALLLKYNFDLAHYKTFTRFQPREQGLLSQYQHCFHSHVESVMNMHTQIKPIFSTCKKQIHQTSLEKKKDPLTSLAESKQRTKNKCIKVKFQNEHTHLLATRFFYFKCIIK